MEEREGYLHQTAKGKNSWSPSRCPFTKGAFGFPEAPRLWCLEFRDGFVGAAFTPSKRHPDTFYFSNKEGEYRSKLVCHVDDSLWAGSGEDFKAALQKARGKLLFKHDKSRKVTVLGRLAEQFEDRTEVSQHEYLKNIKKVYVKKDRRRQPESPLTADEGAAFMSLA